MTELPPKLSPSDPSDVTGISPDVLHEDMDESPESTSKTGVVTATHEKTPVQTGETDAKEVPPHAEPMQPTDDKSDHGDAPDVPKPALSLAQLAQSGVKKFPEADIPKYLYFQGTKQYEAARLIVFEGLDDVEVISRRSGVVKRTVNNVKGDIRRVATEMMSARGMKVPAVQSPRDSRDVNDPRDTRDSDDNRNSAVNNPPYS